MFSKIGVKYSVETYEEDTPPIIHINSKNWGRPEIDFNPNLVKGRAQRRIV